MISINPASSPNLYASNVGSHSSDSLPLPRRPFQGQGQGQGQGRDRRSSFNSLKSVSSFGSALGPLPEDSMLDVSSSISLPRGSDETGRKGEWVLDVDKVEERKEGWRLTERVILVLGEYTPALLHPILHNTLTSPTLIILASLRPKAHCTTRQPHLTIHQLPHPTWAHSTIQDLVEAAIPIAKAYRKKHSRSRSRATLFFSRRPDTGTGTTRTSTIPPAKPHIFDSVITCLSPALRFDPRQAMPKLLREVVMSTTALLACLPSTKGQVGPIGLVNVLPASYPAALPAVVEKYLASLLPTLAPHQKLRPIVLAHPAFCAERVATYAGSTMSAVEAILLDMVHYRSNGTREKLYVPLWGSVLSAPGMQRSGSGGSIASGTGLAEGANQNIDSVGYDDNLLGAALMDRRGSDYSVQTDMTDSTVDNERGPITPSASTDSVDRVGRLSKHGQTGHEGKNNSHSHLASLHHAPAQPSRLSHVETFANSPGPDGPDGPDPDSLTFAPPRYGGFGQRSRSSSLRSEVSVGTAEMEMGDGQGQSAPVGTRKKRGMFGWMRKDR